MRFRDLPIKRKLVGLILLVSISVLIVAGTAMLAYELRNSRSDMSANLSTLAEIISANSSAVLVFDDPDLAREILSGLDAESEIIAAALYDRSGALFAQYPTNATGLPPILSGVEGPQFHPHHFSLLTPVVQGSDRVGTLYLKADYRQMYRRVAIFAVMLLFVLAGSCMLALFLSNFFEWRISGPLLELAGLARIVSEKRDYSVRAAQTGRDELGTLTEAFNAMLARIQASDSALREREERYELVVAGAEAAIWDWDIPEKRVLYSPRWRELRGLSADETSDREEEWSSRIHPEDYDRVMAALKTHFEGLTPVFSEEYRVRRADGHWVWILNRGIVRRDADGRPVRMAGSETDITERKRAEQALLNRTRQQQAVASLGELALRERDTRAVFHRATVLLTETLEVEFGKVLELLPGGDSLLLRAGVGWREGLVGRAIVGAGRDSQAGYTLMSDTPVIVDDLRNETRFHGPGLLIDHGVVSGMSCVIRSAEGTAWGVLGVHSARRVTFVLDDLNFIIAVANILGDVIHRHQAEQSLRESEGRFASFMQHLPGLAWIKDVQGRYIYANDASANVFQTPRESLYGKTDDEVFPPKVAAQFKANDSLALHGGKGVQVVEQLEHGDGGVHHSIVSKFPIPGPDGRTALVGGMAVDITERIRAEEALSRSEARYRGFFEGVAISLWEEDFSAVKAAIDELKTGGVRDFRRHFEEHPEFVDQVAGKIRVRDVNNSTVDMFEARDKAELLGSMPDVFTPESRSVLLLELLALAEGRNFLEGEASLKTLRGKPLSVWFTMTVPPGAADCDRVLFSVLDITRRKKVEEALQESEQRFRMIADNITVLAWTADQSFGVTWYNKQWYDYTGATAAAMRGRGWESVHHPDHLDRVNRKLEEAFQRREVWEDTFPLRGHDGRYRWFLSRAVPIFDDEGNIVRWFGTNADVTELREAQQSLSRLAAIVEFSSDAIISKTLEGIILTWNRGAERMFGYTAEKTVGRSIMMLIPPERRDEELDILARQRRGETIEHLETVRVRKDGSRFEVSLSISPLRDADGEITGISKIARDVTEKKRAERALERARDAAEAANRAKDDFLAALSHELRTPLMPVMVTVSMLQQDRSLPERLRASLVMIRRNIEIQSRMINELLDLSRIRADKLELTLEVVDLHETVRGALDVCRGHPNSPALRIAVELEARDHHVRGDADRLRQVFWNLIQNAMKFTPPGGRIIISSHSRAGVIHVTVSDSGCGIEPDLLSRVFDPFEQGGRKSRESLQGLGLGLAIAQRIIAAHGGTLSAASEGKDLGAAFTVELAAVSIESPASAARPCPSELMSPQT